MNVDLLPARADVEGASPYTDVVIVVDVLRTTTTVPILFDQGLAAVRLSPSLRVARRAAAARGDLLVGERRGVPPEGFNYGNSPVTLAQCDLSGHDAIMVSENAPVALTYLSDARAVALGSMVNLDAVCDWAIAKVRTRVDLVCCGFSGEPDLDDLVTAGLLADGMMRRYAALRPTGATRLALSAVQSYADPLTALWVSRAAAYLRGLGLERDIGFAADLDRSRTVPRMDDPERAHGGVLYPFRPAPCDGG